VGASRWKRFDMPIEEKINLKVNSLLTAEEENDYFLLITRLIDENVTVPVIQMPKIMSSISYRLGMCIFVIT
jgi:hypothetical protein